MKSPTEFTEALANLGWSISKDAIGDPIFSQAIDDNFIEVLFQSFDRSGGCFVPLLLRCGNIRYRKIFSELTNRRRTENAPIRITKDFRFSQLGKAEAGIISKEILQLFSAHEIAKAIDQKSQDKPEFIEDQYEYVAALAWKGDLKTLSEERQLLEMPGSLKFQLNVPVGVLDRAMAMAKPMSEE